MRTSVAEKIGWNVQQILHHAKKVEFLAANVPKNTVRELQRQLDNLERLRRDKTKRLHREPSQTVRDHIRKELVEIEEAREDVEQRLNEVRAS